MWALAFSMQKKTGKECKKKVLIAELKAFYKVLATNYLAIPSAICNLNILNRNNKEIEETDRKIFMLWICNKINYPKFR